MHRTLWAMVVVALAVGGAACGPYSGGQLPDTAFIYDIVPGASTFIQPGTQAGYGITANTGGVYRLVWTGDAATSGVHRHFYGSVWTPGTFAQITGGCISNVCPLESNDYVSAAATVYSGQRVDFDAQTSDGIDGFDVVVNAEPVTFDLYIDGARYPDLVFFSAAANGGAVSTVDGIPFALQGT